MKFMHKTKNQRGDTIVEVLIAITVVSSVLVGAFIVTQKSVAAVRNGQEHSEMLQILQGQVEQVRSLALAENSLTLGVYAPGSFCIDPTNPSSPTRIDATDLKCQNIHDRYNLSISHTGNGIFKFSGSWDDIAGHDSVESLTYRVYPGS